jgi:hypothetical protein
MIFRRTRPFGCAANGRGSQVLFGGSKSGGTPERKGFRALTTNPPWFRVFLFGMLITLIGKGNSVRPAHLEGRPNPKLRPQL